MKCPYFYTYDSENETIAVSPEGYASLWGCDPCYDKPPRLPGDGYLFYNFGSFQFNKDKKFLNDFVDAIQRTIMSVEQDPSKEDKEDDILQLSNLKEWVIYLRMQVS